MNRKQIEVLVNYVFEELENQKACTFKSGRDKAFSRAVALIENEFEKEREIERDAQKMVEQLEEQGQTFERHKMFLMVKRKLAEQKGVIL